MTSQGERQVPGDKRWLSWLPFWIYLLVFALTCLLGALLFLIDVSQFVALYEYFSGAVVPELDGENTVVALLLLLVAPICVGLGFFSSQRLARRVPDRRLELPEVNSVLLTRWVGGAFVLSGSAAILSLARAGSFGRLGGWLDYASHISARMHAFETLGFMEFVNLYVALPLLGAWFASLQNLRILRSRALVVVMLLVVIASGLLVFQKRVAVFSALILIVTLVLRLVRRDPSWAASVLRWGTAAVLGIYIALVVLPVYSQASRTVAEATPASEDRLRRELAAELGFDEGNRARAVALYSIMAPLTRTASSALQYVEVFPGHHPYYGLDLGQDILGFGASPDDGAVVWRFSNPDISGSTTAPFQFVLYSQVGLIGALIGSVIMGSIIGALWWLSTALLPEYIWPVFGCSIVMFSIVIALDGARSSFFASYGLLWFWVTIVLVISVSVLGVRLNNRLRRSDTPKIPDDGESR